MGVVLKKIQPFVPEISSFVDFFFFLSSSSTLLNWCYFEPIPGSTQVLFFALGSGITYGNAQVTYVVLCWGSNLGRTHSMQAPYFF